MLDIYWIGIHQKIECEENADKITLISDRPYFLRCGIEGKLVLEKSSKVSFIGMPSILHSKPPMFKVFC